MDIKYKFVREPIPDNVTREELFDELHSAMREIDIYKTALQMAVDDLETAIDIIDDCNGYDIAIENGLSLYENDFNYYISKAKEELRGE